MEQMRVLVKKGFKLNPNEKIVKGIIKAVERNEGMCPCVHEENCGDLHCPCEDLDYEINAVANYILKKYEIY